MPGGSMVPRYVWQTLIIVKNHKMAKISTITNAIEKINTHLESLEFKKYFDVCFTKFKYNQILLNKIGDRFLLTTKLFNG
jgi:hypothetical protein